MDRELEIIFIEALAALEDGEPVEAILARYPDHAYRLHPLLITAQAASLLHAEPRPAAQARSRAAFLAQAAEQREIAGAAILPTRRRFALRLPLLEIFAAGLLIIGLAIFGYGAMRSALPGSPLYGAKLGIEALQVQMAPEAEREVLLARQQMERIEEIHALLDSGRSAEVSFTGLIESIDLSVWQIAGLSVQVSENTTIVGPRAVGNRATVMGTTQGGTLQAAIIQIQTAIPDNPPPPKVTTTPPYGGESEFVPGNDDPDIMPSPTPGQVIAPSPVLPSPSSTLMPSPTNPPPPPDTPDDDGGDDDNDNEIDDDGDDNSGSGSNDNGDDD